MSSEDTIDRTLPHAHDNVRNSLEAHAPVRPDDESGSATVASPTPQADSPCFPFDESLLDVCRTRWQFGDWARLAANPPEALLHHPERARIALLAAAAHFQLGESQQGHRQLQLALDWGASRRQVMQMLISGSHNCMAEANFLLGRSDRAREHFRDAMRTGGVPGDIELLANIREARRTK